MLKKWGFSLKNAVWSILGLGFIAVLLWSGISGNYQLFAKKRIEAYIEHAVVSEDTLVIDDKLHSRPLTISFSQPVAAAGKIDKTLNDKIKISPAISGIWRFTNASMLQFTPEKNWLAGVKYQVRLPKSLFSPHIKLKKTSFSFLAPTFSGEVISSEFYEDPRDFSNKAAIASFRFNYPLDTKDLKEKISVQSVNGTKHGFSYRLSDADTVLHVMSEPLKIKKEADFVQISVQGAGNITNKKTIEKKISTTIHIPDGKSYFKVNSVTSRIIYNEHNEGNPEQVFFVNFSAAVKPEMLAKHLELYYVDLPCYNFPEALNQARNIIWSVRGAKKLAFTEISEEKQLKNHSFKYNLDRQDGCLVVKIGKKLQSVEGFELGASVIETTDFTPYPKQAEIALNGSLLSRRGSRKLAFVSRGVNELRLSVAKIDNSALNHLATQTYGDFTHPFFKSYDFSEDNIAEIFEKRLSIVSKHPAKPDYSSLDMDEFFKDKKGIFLLKLRGYADDHHYSAEDSRLIVMTDLGIVVKDNLDKTHDVFISNIFEQKPLSGAVVEVLGANGIAVLKAKTNEQGVAKIPDFSNFKKDKKAVVYKVVYEDDVSFLPISYAKRRLEMSRFDVGGEYDFDDEAFKGMVFSDRGIYRPGETVHLGVLIRQNDLNIPLNLPMTLEIDNPYGDTMASYQLKCDRFGLMEVRFNVPMSAFTGQYTISLYTKGKYNDKLYIAAGSFRVKEFAPDNLRIEGKWLNGTNDGWLEGKMIKAAISLSNLYGKPAVGHKLAATYRLIPVDFSFKKYAGFAFKDPKRDEKQKARIYEEDLPEITTDADGRGLFEIDLAKFDQGSYRLYLLADGLELGSGRSVTTNLETLVSLNEFLIGWKANGALDYISKDASREIKFIAIDNKLDQIEQKGLFLSLYSRSYVSNLKEMNNGTYRYQMVPKLKLITKKAYDISSLGTTEKLKTDEAGEYVLELEDKDGLVLAMVEYSVAGKSNLSHKVDKEAGLGLKLDKTEYNPGETISVQITAPYTGYGLMTIERDNVYAYKWFKAQTTSVEEKIVLPEGVEGNAYLNVAFFRDVQSKEIYLPALSYGVKAFNINKEARKLNISLETPQKVKSGTPLVIKYKTNDKANIIVYGVNSGILQAADYKLPNPLAAFMKKKALRVVTSQIMDLVMPDIKFLRTLAASGGGDGFEQEALAKNLNPFARKTDKAVAFWSGILESDENGAAYTYQVPETFNGEIKVMAIGVSKNGFGSAETTVLSRGDFALTASGPYIVSFGDEFVIGLSVDNLLEEPLDENKTIVELEADEAFKIIGESKQTVMLAPDKESLVKFRIKALDKAGAKALRFQVKDETGHLASLTYQMSVRPAVPYSGHFAMGWAKRNVTFDKIENLYDDFRVQQLSASSSPLVLATGLLKYLDKFPYFCTEQSVSRIFPAMEIFFKRPELIKDFDIYGVFDDVLQKLSERQLINGGFRAWSSTWLPADEYDSVYATHFLLKAKELGMPVSSNMLKKALGYCKETASRTPYVQDDFVVAYSIYVLTLNGDITTNYLLKLEQFYEQKYAKTWKNSLAASFMAASYKLLQDENKASELAGLYQSNHRLDDENVINAYLMTTHFDQNKKFSSKEQIAKLLELLNDGRFDTTSAAFALLTLNNMQDDTTDSQISFDGMTPIVNAPFATATFTPQTKEITASANKPFYYIVSQQGFAKGEVKALAQGMEIEKFIYNDKKEPVTLVKNGDELTVKIRYRGLSNQWINDVAIVDLLPGCFEVIDNSVTSDKTPDSVDVREDRVVVQTSANNDLNEISYKVKVVAEGRFVLPPVYGKALYMPLVRANSATGVIISGE